MHAAKIFNALGDPIRLEMMQRLSKNSSETIKNISAGLGITRQGARRHLEVLSTAKLIILEPKGRDVTVKINPASLGVAQVTIEELEKQWETRLEILKNFIESS